MKKKSATQDIWDPGRKKGTSRSRSAKPYTALILSGGGARGAYECGVYASMQEHGISPQVIVGSSVGSINACAIAGGMSPDELEDLWVSLASKDAWFLPSQLKRIRTLTGNRHVFKNRKDLWAFMKWDYLFDSSPLLKTLERYFDVESVRKSKKKLFIVATDVMTGEYTLFSKKELTPRHLLASASIPIAFPWTEIDGRCYWDGGLLANVPPLKPAIDADQRVRDIYLVKLFPRFSSLPTGLLDCIERTVEIALQGTLNNDIRQCEFVNSLIRRGVFKDVYREIRLHTIEYQEPLDALSILDFSKSYVKKLIEHGKRDTDRYFERRRLYEEELAAAG